MDGLIPAPRFGADPKFSMPTKPLPGRSFFASYLKLALFLAAAATTLAQSGGVIVGRVLNLENGSYINNARIVTSDGRTVFTNEYGEFQIADVPPGEFRLNAFFTGLREQTATLTVAAGQTATRDFSLSRSGTNDPAEPVMLNAFVVAAQRETEARAIAINEQRFAPNIKNVVSTDEFGDLGNSSVGDFVKFMPGVVVDKEMISVRGLPPETVSVSMDGNRLATQFAAEQGLRAAALDTMALNNVARIEVTKSPTPDAPADSLGGAVNLVSKRAFERSKPLFSYHAYVGGTVDDISTNEVTGPSEQTTGIRTRPGFDFTYIAPVSKTFGFTLTGLAYDQLNSEYLVRRFWAPHMVSRAGGSAANPYMAQFSLQNGVTYRSRTSLGSTVDWKIRGQDVVSVGIQYTFANTDFNTYTHLADVSGQTNAAAPTAFGPTFTQGATGAARLQYAGSTRRVPITTVMTNLNYRHDGAVWKVEGSGFFSKASSKLRDIDYGHFRNTQLNLNNATLRFDDIGPYDPGRVSVRNSAGIEVDPYALGNYTIGTVFSQPKNELDFQYGGRASARRELQVVVPVTIKTGVDWREQIRDLRSPAPRWNFVGPDRVANTADDRASLYGVGNPDYRDGGGPYSGLSTVEWPSQNRLYNLFREHPEFFEFNEAATIPASTAASKKIVETISAAYVRLDTKLIANRLWLVGGVRIERSEDYGEGQLNDIRATYQQDANGQLVLDAAGRPIRVSSDALVRTRLQYKERGARASKSFHDFYPSLNATFNITEDILARAAYARTLGRPDFNSIVPSIAITDPTSAAANRTITVSDPSLKPWTGNNFDLSLEYYLKPAGLVSVGVFRKDLKDFFGTVREPATLEQLAAFGLGDEFLDYEIIRKTNAGDARVDGVELNYRQELTFLPRWARGVQVFGNLTSLQLSGSSTVDFNSFVRRSYSWGLSLSRPKYSVRLNWHARARQQKNLIVGALIPVDTYTWTAAFTTLDLNCEYRIRKQLAIYAVVRNLTEALRPDEYTNAATPGYAKQRGVNDSPIRFTLGAKGEF